MICLNNWKIIDNNFVLLSYSDGDSFLIPVADFNRAFGAIVSGSKESIKRDFSIN